MDYLIDTHTYIWYVENNLNLSNLAFELIDNSKNNLFLSVASIWEIVIKSSIHKMDLKKSINEIYNELDFLEIKLLQFSQKDFEVLRNLEFHHNDPFDRIIIAQAISNNFDVITRDNNFKPYSINIIW